MTTPQTILYLFIFKQFLKSKFFAKNIIKKQTNKQADFQDRQSWSQVLNW